MRTYDYEHLKQCVKNLFAQARYEFRTIHHIEYKFTSMMTEGMTKCKVFSLWNNAQDSFYATAFELIKIDGGSKIMIDLSIYVKYSDYTASCVMGMCETPNDVFKWLENPNSLQKCLDKIDGLIADID